MNVNEARSSQRFTKRTDIVNVVGTHPSLETLCNIKNSCYCFPFEGLLMLSLLEGDVVISAPPSISQSFPSELQDFFAR